MKKANSTKTKFPRMISKMLKRMQGVDRPVGPIDQGMKGNTARRVKGEEKKKGRGEDTIRIEECENTHAGGAAFCAPGGAFWGFQLVETTHLKSDV